MEKVCPEAICSKKSWHLAGKLTPLGTWLFRYENQDLGSELPKD
jgi:hypothetical protein